jgi:hypothetical protein
LGQGLRFGPWIYPEGVLISAKAEQKPRRASLTEVAAGAEGLPLAACNKAIGQPG